MTLPLEQVFLWNWWKYHFFSLLWQVGHSTCLYASWGRTLDTEAFNFSTHFLSVFSLHAMMSLHDMGVQRLFVLRGVVASLPVAREPKRNNHCNCAWTYFWTTNQPYVLPLPVLLPCVLVQKVFVAVSLSTGSAHVLFSNLMRSYQTVLPDCLWIHSHGFPGGWKTF